MRRVRSDAAPLAEVVDDGQRDFSEHPHVLLARAAQHRVGDFVPRHVARGHPSAHRVSEEEASPPPNLDHPPGGPLLRCEASQRVGFLGRYQPFQGRPLDRSAFN